MARAYAYTALIVIFAAPPAPANDEWRRLLDPELSRWEVWIGVPHSSTPIEWEAKSDNGQDGKPLGLNNDPLEVFQTREVEGETELYVTGQVYGGLTTLEEFSDYHLSLEMKWGEKKWPPRQNMKRDSGLLYHCVGRHGAFWNVWMRCLECQIQEGDFGDFYPLAGTAADIRIDPDHAGKPTFKPRGRLAGFGKTPGARAFSARGSRNAEMPNGEWNTVEVYTLGDKAVHVVNGAPVMLLENTREAVEGGDRALTRGKIQIQSEAAECAYRRVRIRSIREFPKEVAAAVGLNE